MPPQSRLRAGATGLRKVGPRHTFDGILYSTFMLRILFFSLLLTATPALAQTAPAPRPVAPVSHQHCTLVSEGTYSYSSRVSLEYGQGAKDAVQDPELSQDNVAVRKLRSAMAALNYMSSRGWECMGVSTLPAKINPSSGNVDAETGYLLRRPAR